MSGGKKAYYQQRFDSNYNSDSPVLEELLYEHARTCGVTAAYVSKIAEELNLTNFLRRNVIELSNGEGKRLQLALALLKMPKLLVLDNPFLGLDTSARAALHVTINNLFSQGITLVIISPNTELPHCISHAATMDNGKLVFAGELKNYHPIERPKYTIDQTFEDYQSLFSKVDDDFSVAIDLQNVSIKYGSKVVLHDVNWKVNRGELWALSGPNGAGKSTLLSLILADNSHGYLNDFYLFDKKRGTGESIWDIKKRIGYVSPELHLFFQRAGIHAASISNENEIFNQSNYSSPKISCFEAVASGFNDQVGASKNITRLQAKNVDQWMQLLGIATIKNENYNKQSLGMQRLVLLARALVRDTPLLILDEPCQGLDREHTTHFNNVIDFLVVKFKKTLIYVSHYPEDIPSCVDKYLFLENGKVKIQL